MTEVKPPTDDTAVLLAMLQDEVSRLRTVERVQSEGIERVDRDHKRATVMLQLSHEQLGAIKTQCTALRGELDASKDKVLKLEMIIAEKNEQIRQATDDLKALELTSEETRSSLSKELAALKCSSSVSAESISILRAEVGELRQQLKNTENERERCERLSFEKVVAIETRLKQKCDDLQFLEGLRNKEQREVVAREYELSRTISELRSANEELAAALDREKREAFRQITMFKSQMEMAVHNYEELQKRTSSSDKILITSNERLQREVAMLKERLEESTSSAKAREQVLDSQIAKLCADLRAAQQEINEMADRSVVVSKQHLQSTVALSAQNNAATSRIKDLEQEVETLKEKIRTITIECASERDQLHFQHESRVQELQKYLAEKSEAIRSLTTDLQLATARARTFEQELRIAVERHANGTAASSAEISSLKAEISGYRNAVHKLEKHIEDNYEVTTLREQNEQLEQQIQQLKSRLAQANSALANVRIEADIAESYRVKVLHDQVEAQLSRVTALEKERKVTRPLIDALVQIVRRNGDSDPHLQSEIDSYYRGFGAAPSPTKSALLA
jgi:chromosome segregation ATPase